MIKKRIVGLLFLVFAVSAQALMSAQVTDADIDKVKAANPGADWIDPAIQDKLNAIKPQTAVDQMRILSAVGDRGVQAMVALNGATISTVTASTAGAAVPELNNISANTPVVVIKGKTRYPQSFRGYDPTSNLPITVVVDKATGKELVTAIAMPKTPSKGWDYGTR